MFFRNCLLNPKRCADLAASMSLYFGSSARRIHFLPSRSEKALPPNVRARRDALEQELENLRATKGKGLTEDAYYAALESLMVKLARLYEDASQ